MAERRIAYWDNLKFFLIFLVVLGHFLTQDVSESPVVDSIVVFIYSFHMPLFMFVSGIFHRNSNIREKCLFYMVIYVVLKVLLYLVRVGFGVFPSFRLLSEDGVPWFMFALTVFTLLTYGFRHVDRKYVLVISLLLGCFCGYDKHVGDYLVLSRIIVFYPFYLMGNMISRGEIEGYLENRKLRLAGAGLLILWLIICLMNQEGVHTLLHLFTGRNRFQSAIRDAGWLYRILCYGISVLACGAFLLITPRRELPLITTFGKRTIQVYFWHRIFLYLMVLAGMAETMTVTAAGHWQWAGLAMAVTMLTSLPIFRYPMCLFSQWIYHSRRNVKL